MPPVTRSRTTAAKQAVNNTNGGCDGPTGQGEDSSTVFQDLPVGVLGDRVSANGRDTRSKEAPQDKNLKECKADQTRLATESHAAPRPRRKGGNRARKPRWTVRKTPTGRSNQEQEISAPQELEATRPQKRPRTDTLDAFSKSDVFKTDSQDFAWKSEKDDDQWLADLLRESTGPTNNRIENNGKSREEWPDFLEMVLLVEEQARADAAQALLQLSVPNVSSQGKKEDSRHAVGAPKTDDRKEEEGGNTANERQDPGDLAGA